MTSAPPQAPTPQQLYVEAFDALDRREWSRAGTLAAHALRVVPDNAALHFVVGVAALEMQQLPAAASYLRRAADLEPARAGYRAQLARALALAGAEREAREAAALAVSAGPRDAVTFDTLGVVQSRLNAHDDAAAMFRCAVDAAPANAGFRFNLGTSLTAAGRLAEAEEEFDACVGVDPRFWRAYTARAQLRTQTPERNHVDALEFLLASHASDATAVLYLGMALSKELEDLGEHPRAFAALVAGKAGHRARHPYDPAGDRGLFEAITATFDGPAQRPGFATREPIFVVGMPRSGTTLVERILSMHPEVKSCGELQNLGVVVKRASGSTTRALLDVDTVRRSAGLDWAAVGRAYLESTRPATGAVPRFVDKLPHNFLYIGHIARALPEATIVCLRRDPLDTCLGNFRQLFAPGSAFAGYTFDLLDTGRYYMLFDRLMAHWQRAFPGRILELRYESLVADQEAQTRCLLAHAGLDWHDDCLAFERNSAPVATASAVQVRSGMSSAYVQRWRRLEAELQPLRRLLESAGVPIED